MSDPRKLADVIGLGSLAELAREAERRNLETAAIRRLLPPAEAEHLVSASTNAAGELVRISVAPRSV
jgi:hypothetical protein